MCPYNAYHCNRHSAAAGVSANEPAVAQLKNPVTSRLAKVVVKGDETFVVVLDTTGLEVTKFKRKPSQGGIEGAIAYLKRVGYQEEKFTP